MTRDLEFIFDSAQLHGQNDDPDHEVGDLQDALRIAWELLDESGRSDLVRRFVDEVATDLPSEAEDQ